MQFVSFQIWIASQIKQAYAKITWGSIITGYELELANQILGCEYFQRIL